MADTLPAPRPLVVVGKLTVDTALRTAWVDGRRVKGLQPRQSQLLMQLAHRVGRAFSKADFVEVLHPPGTALLYPEALSVHVHHLRKAIHAAGGPRNGYIESVRGQGYTLRAPPDDNDA